jgi:uncharacterized protein (DUF1501 family)
MSISRRDFLKTSVAMVPTLAMMPAVFRRSVAAALLESPAAASSNRTLIVVQMAGGNDPLNTLVPYGDGRYYDLRPDLAIPEDLILPLDREVGLHSSLADLKTLWDQGMLAIVEGVGYPRPNYSHFSSMDIWQSADPEAKLKHGWLGRYFEMLESTQGVFAGLTAGNRTAPELFSATVPVPVVPNIARYQLQGDPRFPEAADARAEALLNLYAASPSQAPYSMLLDTTINAAQRSSLALQQADQDYTQMADYPDTRLANALKVLAEAIVGDLGVKVGHVTIGGFDTHATQAGPQADLLREVSGAVRAFYEDIKAHGKDRDVVVMTWSEFGRRARSNASNGTDHGDAGLQFILGTPVKGGLYGERPDLGNLDNDNLRFTTDFRSVYATVLEQWLGAPAEAVLGNQRFETLPFLTA